MAEKLIGAQIKEGTFRSKDTGKEISYNNLVLYTTSGLECGEMANTPVKIANNGDNILKVFGRSVSMEWLKEQLGRYIDVFYDKWQKVERVIFYDSDPNADLLNGNIQPPPVGGMSVADTLVDDKKTGGKK